MDENKREELLRLIREELRPWIEELVHDAATIAVAMFAEHLKQWIRGWFKKLAMQLLDFLWKPAILGVIALGLWAFWKLREYL